MQSSPLSATDTEPAIASIAPQPTIVEQAYRAILDAICEGRLEPGERLTQESVAAKLAVSRQPIGQALMLLRQQKFLVEAGRRGLMVAPLDRDFLRQIYELRLGIDPLASSLAARHAGADARERGEGLIANGLRAVGEDSIAGLIRADMAFHMFVYELSGNRLFVDTMGQLWNHLRRAMREVLERRAYREAIWVEHRRILDAVLGGRAEDAAVLAREHLRHAAANVEIALPDASDQAASASPAAR